MGVWGEGPNEAQGQSPGQRLGVRSPPEADDIFLFQRLISLKKIIVYLGNLDYMARVRTCLCEHRGGAQSHFSQTFTAVRGKILFFCRI